MNNGGAEAAVAPVGGPQPLEWKFSQVFGERTAGEEIHDGSRSSFTTVSKCDMKQRCLRVLEFGAQKKKGKKRYLTSLWWQVTEFACMIDALDFSCAVIKFALYDTFLSSFTMLGGIKLIFGDIILPDALCLLISSPLLNLIELEITLLPEIEEVGWFCLKGQTLKMYVADCFLLFFYISEAVLFVSLTVLLQCSDDPSPSSSIYALPIHMALKNTVSMLWISLMSLF
ncbi:hypothetical protein GOBAR_DD07034 [Gossypium barbadense]|nr:hypothetical protein GOBAR_DD07034 [Gossypium barbadense]